jgi:hypothetical protein
MADEAGTESGMTMIADYMDVAVAGFAELPGRLMPVDETLPARLDRQLGYFGDARFCMFHFDVRTDGVIWNDGRSYGFGAGAWRPFDEHIAPLAQNYGADHRHALVIDRETRTAYFTPLPAAEQMVADQHLPAACRGAA